MSSHTFIDPTHQPHWMPYIIEYRGIFDLEGFYKMVIKWLQDRSFEWHEKIYKHKPSGGGAEGTKEQEMKWEAWQKSGEYIMYWIDLFFHVWDMREVEVIKDGQKVKMIKGRIRIVMFGKVDKDWQKKFTSNNAMRRLRGFFDKYITYKDRVVIWSDMLAYKMMKLQNEMKEYLGMSTPTKAYYHYMGPDQSG